MKTNKHIEEFDQLLQSKLKDAKVQAPEGVWEAVSGQVATGSSAIVGTSTLIKTILVASVVTGVSYLGYKAIAPSKRDEVKENTVEQLDENMVNDKNPEESIAAAKEEFIYTEDNSSSFGSQVNQSKKGEEEDNVSRNSSVDGGGKSLFSEESDSSITHPNQIDVPETKNQTSTFDLDLKTYYCRGEQLELSIDGSEVDQYEWKVNGRKVALGEALNHKLTELGTLRVELYMNGSLIGKGVSEVDGLRLTLSDLYNKEGRIVLMTNAEDAIWYTSNQLEKVQANKIELTNKVDEYIPLTLVAKSNNGCVDSIKKIIENQFVANGGEVVIPDAFIPGKDGLNDHFIIKIENEKEYHLMVFDVEGNIVFQSRDKNTTWDGTCNGQACAPGTYSYVFKYMLKGSEKTHVRKGRIVLFKEKY